LPFAFLGLYIGILIACQILIIASWTILKPFIFIRRMLTNTLDNSGNVEFKGGRMKVHYKNTFQLVFFGVFGNLFYFVAMFLLLSTLISFRPDKTGYIIKSPAFTTGDQVVVKIDDKRYLTVYEDTVDGLNHYDPDVVVLTDSGRETVSYFDICGKYDTSLEGNTEPLKVSILGFVKWLPGRIVREIGSGWWKFKALMVGTENM
jgi:hypothetical protein